MLYSITEENFHDYWDYIKPLVDSNLYDLLQFDGSEDQLRDLLYSILTEQESFIQIYYHENCGFIITIYQSDFTDEEIDKYVPSNLILKFLSFNDEVQWIEEDILFFEEESKKHDISTFTVEMNYDWKTARRFLSRERGYKVDHILFAKEIDYGNNDDN